MCSPSCKRFVRENLAASDVAGKKVLEVGSRAVGGPASTVRPDVEALAPLSYLGVDIISGQHVDEVCNASDLRERYGDDAFDVVISTEMLEHARDWRSAIRNLKNVVRPGGVLVLTTRSFGFPFHAWPHDYWRYEPDDMRQIFDEVVRDLVEL